MYSVKFGGSLNLCVNSTEVKKVKISGQVLRISQKFPENISKKFSGILGEKFLKILSNFLRLCLSFGSPNNP